MDEGALAASLAEAGLDYQGMVDPLTPLIPPAIAGFADSCPAPDMSEVISLPSDDPQLRETANSAWHRLSVGNGLFTESTPEFLLAVNCAEPGTPRTLWWSKVALLSSWDIAGAGGATGILGNGYGHPAFVMLSLEGSVVVRGTQGEQYPEFIAVRSPGEVELFQQRGTWAAGRPRTGEFTIAAIERWLAGSRLAARPAPITDSDCLLRRGGRGCGVVIAG
ncbi:hypothetical protein [Streptomyces cavernicola]|uniref:SMI1/KNR4 family protein n=1 Tax=Streptomyces cavernicola TaxID=3043613 RepID=A0ABT6SMU0_9ACTN|nr:hypothetical protein [Streptomyces sp. B-S-A6]MDI3409502.1 hypothetical protein [Streptomyces sp. B-S-A6]